MEKENDVKTAEVDALEQQKMDEEQAFLEDWTKLTDELIEMGSYLEEYHILRRVAKRVEERIKEISEDALREAMEILQSETPARESGAFEYGGMQFEVSAKPVYDFVDHANRYTMEEGVEYRKLAQEKQRLAELSKAKTDKMASITRCFKTEHPDWTPDWTELTLKVKGRPSPAL